MTELTLTLDDALAEQAQALAARHHMSVEALFAAFVRRASQEQIIDQFLQLARSQSGRSEPGWRFDRDACHERR